MSLHHILIIEDEKSESFDVGNFSSVRYLVNNMFSYKLKYVISYR